MVFRYSSCFFCVSLPGKKLKIFFPGGWKNLCCQPVTSNYDPSFRSSDGLTRTGGTEVYSQEMIDEADTNNVNNGQSAIGFACGFRPSQFTHLVAIIQYDIQWYIMIYLWYIYIYILFTYIYTFFIYIYHICIVFMIPTMYIYLISMCISLSINLFFYGINIVYRLI